MANLNTYPVNVGADAFVFNAGGNLVTLDDVDLGDEDLDYAGLEDDYDFGEED